MLGFHPIAGAPLSSLGAGDLTLLGLQVTATGGALTPDISVALTGQSCTASQGTIGTEVPLLVPMEVVVSRGTMTPLIDVVPIGQAVTASPGALTPHVQVALTGLSCTSSAGQFMPRLSGTTLAVSRGTIVPEVSVVLTGHAITVRSTSPGFVTSDSMHVNVGLLGYTPAISAGVATPAVAAGTAATTFTPSPAVTTNTSSTQAFNRAIGHVRNQSPYLYGKYWFVGEIEDGSGADWQTVVISPSENDSFVILDPETRTFAFAKVPNWQSTYSIADLNPKLNGNRPQTFDDSGLQYDGAPYKWAMGVAYGVGVEGNFGYLRIRTFEDTPYTYPAMKRFMVYQEAYAEEFPSGFAGYNGLEVVHDVDVSRYQSSAGAEDGPVNGPIGVVPLRPTKLPLSGGSPATLKVQNALIFHPSLWNDGTNDHWVPTYTKVTKDLNPVVNVQKITNDVQLRSWTGVASLWAMQSTMVITHSGYGNVAYLAYLASTSGAPRTPSYVGVIVMDLETQEVFAQVVKPLAAVSATPTTEDLRYQEEWPQRPMSEAIKLASGRSVTQFAIRGYIVNLSWTEGTHRNPTITPKDGPSTGNICTGVDFLEVRGDTVYHVMMRGNSALPTAFRTVYNDATSTSASWTVPGSDLWSWTLTFSASSKAVQFYSGSHKGKQTWFGETVYDNNVVNNLEANGNRRSGEAWVDFWSAQNPVLSVEAEGRVGRLEPVITDCGISVTLTGHQIGVTASNGLISGENKTVALTGHQINANYTCPVASVNVTVPLVGYQMECAQGRMSLIGDPVEVKLTGLHMCMQMNTPSTLPPGTVQLAGFAMTASGGSMVPHISVTLTGQACTASGGTLDASVPLLAGLQITASDGALTPAIAVTPAGQVATAASGSLGITLGATLPGQSATASRGTLVPHVTVALTGHAMTASAGTITPTCGVTLTGQQAACAQGASAPGISVRMSSLAIVSASGAFVPLHTVNLASNLLTTSKGNFVVFMARALSGQVMTVQQGAVGLSYDCNFTLGSVQARGQVGSLTTNLPTPAADAFLWVNDDRDDELFAVVSQLDS